MNKVQPVNRCASRRDVQRVPRRSSGLSQPAASVSTESPASGSSDRIVKVKNASGEARGRFEVLGIDRPIFTPTDSLDTFQNNILLVGVVPDKEDHPGRFCILLEPLDVDGIGLAVISGVCPSGWMSRKRATRSPRSNMTRPAS